MSAQRLTGAHADLEYGELGDLDGPATVGPDELQGAGMARRDSDASLSGIGYDTEQAAARYNSVDDEG